MLPLHGIGGRTDLPIPLWLAAYAGAVAVLSSFFVLAALWTRPRLRGASAGRPVAALQTVVDSRLVRVALQVLGLILLFGFLFVAWVGPDDDGRHNPAPTWFYVWFWVGLVPLSLLFGPIWALLNPIRTVVNVTRHALRIPVRAVPEWLGYWPAVGSLLAFLWLELVYDHAASPRAVAAFVTSYCLVHWLAGVVFGPLWFDRGDGFQVYSSLVARAAAFGRRCDGVLVVRSPLDGLAGTPMSPDPTPAIVVVLGSTAFDGLSRTPVWKQLVADTDRVSYLLWGGAGLITTIAVVALTYNLALGLTRRYVGDGDGLRAEFAHTLIPIAIGYTIAHYFSFALFQGQQGILLAGDPLVRGWDLLGLASTPVNYTLLSLTAIGLIQTMAIVVGHVVGITAAHDRAVALLPSRNVRTGQYPLLLLMVGFTTAGIALIAGA
ncbi:MAG: hypothetical protein HOV67_25150 [Kribbellaceae bacterium]|nr:hypothetical protein [Kribbellaceae bacterium]